MKSTNLHDCSPFDRLNVGSSTANGGGISVITGISIGTLAVFSGGSTTASSGELYIQTAATRGRLPLVGQSGSVNTIVVDTKTVVMR